MRVGRFRLPKKVFTSRTNKFAARKEARVCPGLATNARGTLPVKESTRHPGIDTVQGGWIPCV